MKNIGEFLEKYTKKNENSIAFEIKRNFRKQKLTYREIYDYSLKFANFLAFKGLKKRDKILIWSPNTPEWVIIFLGSLIAGVVVVPVDFRTSSGTVSKFIKKTKPKLAFQSKYLRQNLKSVVKEVIYVEDIKEMIEHFPTTPPKVKIKKDDLAEIVFTSGTTGEPKGVMLTHLNILSDLDALSYAIPVKHHYEILSVLPLSHMYGQIILLLTIKMGAKTIFLPKINSVTIVNTLQENKINIIPVVPQFLKILLDSIERRVKKEGKEKRWRKALKIASYLPFPLRRILFRGVHKNLGNHLEIFASGGAPLDLRLARTWELIGVKIIEGYGATEVTAGATATRVEDRRLESVGKILPGVELKLNPDGEILIKGDMVSPGYYKDSRKTKEVFRDGWYNTKDIGKFDEEGYLHILGRDDFRIVLPDGLNVYPEDIENKINKHPLVWDSVVLGIKREEGEVVHAVLVLKEKGRLDKIIEEVNEELESHQQIMEYSLWPDKDFPRTITLKPDRKKIFNIVSKKEHFNKKKQVKKQKVQFHDKLFQIISSVTKVGSEKITEKSNLVMDLKLDSLGRLELIALIEEEFGITIDEMKITPQTKVLDLMRMIKKGKTQVKKFQIKKWLYGYFPRVVRECLQRTVVFPLLRTFVTIEVKNKENLKKIPIPSILIFNHAGNADGLLILKILPSRIRLRSLIAAMAEHWEHEYRLPILHLFLNVFPFVRSGGAIRSNFENIGKFLDRGFCIILAPEGEVQPEDKIQEFKQGIGFIAVGMGVPVVPFKIEGYHGAYPLGKKIPQKEVGVTIKVGEPIEFPKDISYLEATQKLREALESL